MTDRAKEKKYIYTAKKYDKIWKIVGGGYICNDIEKQNFNTNKAMRRFLTLVIVAMFAITALAQRVGGPAPQYIPVDKDVRMGKLENGMTYYIRHNAKQKGLANFHILHSVGAIQEDDNQQGLAHFLEHMAFNGTTNLPGKSMMEYLESIGVKFGANLNAGTSWDYTSYLMTDVPVKRQGIIDTAMLVLHDWSHFITLNPKEIDSERGVIKEELRTRDGAGWRSTIQLLKALFKGTKYEHRNLIGHLDGLSSFKYDDIKSFYHKWYRPDYQAVIVVGDIDAAKIEEQVKTLMADIPAPAADAAKKEVIVVPDNQEPIISIMEDPEAQHSRASLYIKHQAIPKEMRNTQHVEFIKTAEALGRTMAANRISEITMKPNAPFIAGHISNSSVGICPTLETLTAISVTEDGELLKGFEAIYTELLRIARHGFTQGELEIAKASLMRACESAYANRNDRLNGDYVRRYTNHFYKNEPIPNAELEWQMDSTMISQMPIEVINHVFKAYATDNNNVVVVNTPKKKDLVAPTEAEILAVMQKVRASEIEPYKDNTVKVPLIEKPEALRPSPVKKEAKNELYGTTEWTLKNGMKIVVKPTTFKADEVFILSVSNKGNAHIADELYHTADNLSSFVEQMGVSKFSMNDLKKQLAGKRANIMTMFDDEEAAIIGITSPKDVETCLQLMHLYFTDPRFDKNDFDVCMNQYRSATANQETDPDYLFSKERSKVLYNNHFRCKPFSSEVLDMIKFEQLAPIYKELMGNACEFTTYVIGNVDLTTLQPLVERYIGSLPGSKKLAKEVDDGIRLHAGTADFKVKMQQPKVRVSRTYSGDMEYTIKNKTLLSVLAQILRMRYTESIREEKGGTYGVRTGANLSKEPAPTYSLIMQFDTNEQMADELSEILIAEVRKIAEQGPKAEDVEKVREYLLKEWKKQIEQNSKWISMLQGYYNDGLDYMRDYENIVKGMTYDDIKALAKKIVDDNRLAYIVMRPEK